MRKAAVYRGSLESDGQRRERILAAAARVFERDGLAKASMRAIAKEAACTTGAIYPLFEGKEDIYASLLEESLEGLHAAVASASAVEAEAIRALEAGARAWHQYYQAHPFEADLGLYLHGAGELRGLGKARDRKLNAHLRKTLDVFAACFVRLAPASVHSNKVDTWARAERDALFAQLIGIVILSRSGRSRSIGAEVHNILETSLHAVRQRLT